MEIRTVFTVIKYLFSFFLIIVCYIVRKDPVIFGISILELLAVVILSNEMLKKSILYLVVHDILILLLNTQTAVMLFSGSWISLLLLSNLDMAYDLAGLSALYIGSAVLIIVISFLPICIIETTVRMPGYRGLSALLAIELIVTMILGSGYSPMAGFVQLIQEANSYSEIKAGITATDNAYARFYRKDIWDARTKDATFGDQPNVILIFAEGLSRHILSDPRNIMPNIAEFEKKSIHFENYFNHTFATYRGLIGQLYSGFQLDNYDSNALISMQSILRDQDYHTCIINTEPYNRSFTQYLQNMDFQEFISDTTKTYNGKVNTLSDTEAFELLYETVCRLEADDSPYFTVMYTMGTHMTFDGETSFGDGSDMELNKFRNLDVQFSSFFEKFQNSSLRENTILIFTTDHATYVDEPDLSSFSAYCTRQHNSLDEIPLCIYYQGVTPETINAEGRNTLDLAPTICDLLDISVPNYFLGISLFYPYNKENGVFYDTVYFSGATTTSTKDGRIADLSAEDKLFFFETLKQYFSISRQ